MNDEPTLGEVIRQVRDLVRQVRDLVQEVRADYVRKELYEARHHGLTRRVDDLEREADEREKARVAFQRTIIAGIVVGVVVMLANLAVTAIMLGGIAK